MKSIYLDNSSTTVVYKEVVREMERIMCENYGNPSSPHALGEKALKEIENAKKIISKEINCKPEEIIFTSGATEANNIALLGIAGAYPKKKKIIISGIEHSSVYEPCIELRKKGYKIVEIPADKWGIININELENKIDSDTLMVSIIHGHNEIGVVQDIAKISRMCKNKKVLFHTDAVQTFGKEKIDVKSGIDLLSASGHKIHGPKGIGFLYIKQRIRLKPLFYGGSQELRIRPGTENMSGILGMCKALELIKKADKNKIRKLRNYFIVELEKLSGKINGSKARRLYNNIHVSFLGKDAEFIVLGLSEKGICCSSKSACLTRQKGENRVLKALGMKKKEMLGSMRFTLSEFTTKKI